jgi:hypothetical protein
VTANTVTWNSVRDEILSNPEVKTEYDALSPEFELARAVITLAGYEVEINLVPVEGEHQKSVKPLRLTPNL